MTRGEKREEYRGKGKRNQSGGNKDEQWVNASTITNSGI